MRIALFVGALALSAAVGDQYPYDQPGDKKFVNDTAVLERTAPGVANNRSTKLSAPRAQVTATFTSRPIVVDGVREAAWDAATPFPIAHAFNPTMTGDAPEATARGTLRLLWDGPVLYLLVEVTGDTTRSDAGTPTWNTASYTPDTDGLFVWMDVFNDQWGMETDTQGVFFAGANPSLTSATSFSNAGIPSLGSFFNAGNQDYATRLKAVRSSGYRPGGGVNYTYEIALQIEGWGDEWDRPLTNGTEIGLEIGLFDQGTSFTHLSRTSVLAGREGNSNLPNSERVRNRDWAVVTLAGWNRTSPFASSTWRADEDLHFWNSKGNPGRAVWTARSGARMTAATQAYVAIKDRPGATRTQKDAAVLEVCRAFAALRWVDQTYPDPHDLPTVNVLPNIWQFFDRKKGTRGMVTNTSEWVPDSAWTIRLRSAKTATTGPAIPASPRA
jgi:hypothetical protein